MFRKNQAIDGGSGEVEGLSFSSKCRLFLLLWASFVLGSVAVALAESPSRTALNTSLNPSRSGSGARVKDASESERSGQSSQDVPDPKTTLPPPQVEMDVVDILADFPRQERPYIQLVVHTVKDLQLLNKQCTKKAALFAQKGVPKHVSVDQIDLADVSKFNQGYLRYFDPLRSYLRSAYKRFYAVQPPQRFEKPHKYWLAYLAYALENLDQQRLGDQAPARPSHSPVAVAQYRAWACRLYKENGLDLSAYVLN